MKRKLIQSETNAHSLNNDELVAEKRRTEHKLMQARSKVEDMRCEVKVKSEIF